MGLFITIFFYCIFFTIYLSPRYVTSNYEFKQSYYLKRKRIKNWKRERDRLIQQLKKNKE